MPISPRFRSVRAACRAGMVLAHLVPVTGLAQTNDQVFRSWRWEESTVSPRAFGFGGAFVALANDLSASQTNPAGLADLPPFLELSYGHLPRIPRGDDGTARFADRHRALAPLSLGRFGCRWGVSLFFASPLNARLDLESAARDGSREEGSFEARARGAGGAAGVRLRSGLAVGANVSVSWLRSSGEYQHFTAAGTRDTGVTFGGGSGGWSLSTGILYKITRRARVGGVYRRGSEWSIERRPEGVATSPPGGPPARVELRAPDVLSAGASYYFYIGHRRAFMTVTGQVDRVRYSQARDALTVTRGPFARSDYALADATEPRLGLEVSIPTRCWSGCGALVQVRAGVHRQAPGSLAYEGPDVTEAAAFAGGSRRWRPAAGASVAALVRVPFTQSSVPIRLDAGARFGGTGTAVLVALSLRYGVSFRDGGPR